MKITHIARVAHQGGGRFRDVAVFNAEVADGLNLLGMKLALAPDGKKFIFSPLKSGQRFVQFNGSFARELSAAAWNALEGNVAHDHDR